MNEGHQERIVESFLEEMLTNQHPPDLTDLIQERLRAELGPEGFEQLKRGGLKRSTKSPTAASQTAKRSTDSGTYPTVGAARPVSWTTLSATALTLAAGLMLSLAIWQYWSNSDHTHAPAQAQHNQPAPSDSAIAKTLPEVAQPEIPKVKELPLDQLPFGVDTPAPQIVSRPPAAAPVAAMQEDEIIQWMDERFSKLWDSEGLATQVRLSNEQWLAQINSRLGGPPNTEADSPREMAQKLVRTAGFAESFSDRIVSFWLRGTAEADAKNAAGSQLRSYLAEQLVARKPWNEVLASLVASQPDEPQSVWLASLAGGGNHRLAARIGSVMLDEALACARCHDASENGRIVSMDQDDYWSLVAMFSGVDVKPAKANPAGQNARLLVDNQRQMFEGSKLPPVYFDRPDGRVQAARYRLPGGDDWRAIEDAHTPRESLARWINRSSITDQASVNLAWRLVYGRPLVAQHAALDGEGYAQRREILAMLAEQFQAHNRDMGQLVTWLVASRPFAQGVLEVDRSRWLAASEDEIVQWSNAAANFAAKLPDQASPATRSLETALASIDKWSGNRDERRATLAQPTPVDATKVKPKRDVKATESEPLLGYLIHSVKPNYAQGLFINRLVKSKLQWEQQVDHIAGLIGEPAGNARLHESARKILDDKNGDRAAALFQLLQGALICY